MDFDIFTHQNQDIVCRGPVTEVQFHSGRENKRKIVYFADPCELRVVQKDIGLIIQGNAAVNEQIRVGTHRH